MSCCQRFHFWCLGSCAVEGYVERWALPISFFLQLFVCHRTGLVVWTQPKFASVTSVCPEAWSPGFGFFSVSQFWGSAQAACFRNDLELRFGPHFEPPKSGPSYGTHQQGSLHTSEVGLFWRHADWLQGKVPESQVAVFINLDETAVHYSYYSAKGLVSLTLTQKPQLMVPKGDRRGGITHVALLSNVLRVQQHLPQVLICNPRKLTKTLLRQLNVNKPDNVWLLRQRSAWNTTAIMAWLIQLIGYVFRTKLAGTGFQPILLMDAASIHWAQPVVRAARLQGIFLLPVPPACTPLVQPLDVYTFSRYKQKLECLFRDHRMAQQGPVTAQVWFHLLFQAIDWLRSEPWHQAFALVGLPNQGLNLHQNLAKHFSGGRLHFSQPERLSPAELATLLPKRYKLVYEDWVGAPEHVMPRLE